MLPVFTVTNPLFQNVEVVDDDRDEEVECEESSKDDEYNKVEVWVFACLEHWLDVHLSTTLIIQSSFFYQQRLSV